MQFHEVLNYLMKRRGVNQAQLCKMTGIATSAMSHYVRGETEPSFTKVVLIARALNAPVDMFAGKDIDPERLSPDQMEVSDNERQLINLYRNMDAQYRAMLLKSAEAFVGASVKEAQVQGDAVSA